LASMGFDAAWGVLGAADVGANHQRDRIWIVARRRDNISHAEHKRIGWREQQQESTEETDNAANPSEHRCGIRTKQHVDWRETKTDIGAHGKKINMADTDSMRELQQKRVEQDKRGWISDGCKNVSNSDSSQCKGGRFSSRANQKHAYFGDACWWSVEPDVGRVANGVAARVDRLKAIGNGQVPIVAATAWIELTKALEKMK